MFDMEILWLILCGAALASLFVVTSNLIEGSAYWQRQAPLRDFLLGIEERWLDMLVYAVLAAFLSCAWYVMVAMSSLFAWYRGSFVDSVDTLIGATIMGGLFAKLMEFCGGLKAGTPFGIRPLPGLPPSPANPASWIADAPHTVALLLSVALAGASVAFGVVVRPQLLWFLLGPLPLLLFAIYVFCIIGQGYRDFGLQCGPEGRP